MRPSISNFQFLISILFLSLISCRSDPIPEPVRPVVASEPAAGDAYVSASIGDASRLNPLLATDSASGDICGQVFNGLVKYNRDLKLVGELAESWEILDKGREIVFKLRQDVWWHDHKPFTSADVKFTYDRLVDPNVATPYGADYKIVLRVETPDPYTVRVVYDEPFAPALESWGMGIIPKHVFDKGDFNTHPANRRPVGTGPYRFVEWKTDERIILEPNEKYFQGRPYFNRYIYRIIPDTSVQFLELRQETIDSMGLRPDQYLAYPEFFKHYNKFRYPSFSYTYFAFNLKNPLFQDKRVRQAMACALDKNEIIDGVLLGFGRPATGPFPPSSWAFNQNVTDDAYDVGKAKALLAEAGWQDSDNDGWLDNEGKKFEFTLLTNQGNKLRELSAVIIQSHFAKVGIKVKVRILEWAAFIHQYVDKRKFDALILGWSLSRDPDQYVIWHSSQKNPGQYNFVSYHNPAADRLLDRGRREFDFEKRKEIYNDLHALLAEDLPYIFLYYAEALPTVHKRIMGPEVAPAGLSWNFEKWFVPKALQKYQY